MGVVLLARDEELERPVALKLLDESLARDAVLRGRFEREARAAGQLSHPNLVRVFDAGADGDRPYIVMEYVDGETLAEVLRRRGPLPAAEAVELGLQACAGLAAVHARGLVHRDVKPQNLLLARDGVLKLTDFGIAWAADATQLTQVGTVLGTAAYVAPEQAAGALVTSASDVYALAAVLYEALTGAPPRRFASMAEVVQRQDEAIAPIRAAAPDTPAEVEHAVLRCLSPEPAARPPDAAAFARELRGLAPVPPAPVPLYTTRRRLAPLALLLAAVAVAAGVVAWAAAGSNGRTKPAPPVAPVPHGSSAQAQARNLSAWLRAHAAR